MRIWGGLILALLATLSVAAGKDGTAAPIDVEALLRDAPIIDGHDDFPIHYVTAKPAWSLDAHDFAASLPGQIDLPRLRKGHVGASLLTLGSDLEPDAPGQHQRVLVSFDWFDRFTAKYAGALSQARRADDVAIAERQGKIALIPALEGGEQLDATIAHFPELYRRGLRALILIYDGDNAFGAGAKAFQGSMRIVGRSTDGLTELGAAAVREMNRLGIIIDMSHAAASSVRDALEMSRAPIILSHSNARALCDTERNAPDDVLRAVARNGGIVMATPVPYLTTNAFWRWWDAGEKRYAELVAASSGNKSAVKQGMDAWDKANAKPTVTVSDFADQIEYIARVAGENHVGIGSDFDGMGEYAIKGLEDASLIPAVFSELARRGWSAQALRKLSRENFLRVWREVERVAQEPQ